MPRIQYVTRFSKTDQLLDFQVLESRSHLGLSQWVARANDCDLVAMLGVESVDSGYYDLQSQQIFMMRLAN